MTEKIKISDENSVDHFDEAQRFERLSAPEATPNQSLKQQWFSNVRADLLSGTVVALALIPEAIAFSIIAGVDPKVGLYASFIIAVLTGIFGGRIGMISAATAAMAVLFVYAGEKSRHRILVRRHDFNGHFAVRYRRGQIRAFMRFVPRAVMVGFVNALAILIFLAQLPQFKGANWMMYAMILGSLGIIYGLPHITKVVPSALVAIVSMTVVAIALKLDLRYRRRYGRIAQSVAVVCSSASAAQFRDAANYLSLRAWCLCRGSAGIAFNCFAFGRFNGNDQR